MDALGQQPWDSDEITPDEALTCIHRRIHYTTTPGETDELDQVQIDNFLNTLAEVALSIARRQDHQNQCEQ